MTMPSDKLDRAHAAGCPAAGGYGSSDRECICGHYSAALPETGALDALRELVTLKNLKDALDGIEAVSELGAELHQQRLADYQRRKPLAWERARAVVAGTNNAAGQVSPAQESRESDGKGSALPAPVAPTSDTPRTDAVCRSEGSSFIGTGSKSSEVVSADFARQLERELAETHAAWDETSAALNAEVDRREKAERELAAERDRRVNAELDRDAHKARLSQAMRNHGEQLMALGAVSATGATDENIAMLRQAEDFIYECTGTQFLSGPAGKNATADRKWIRAKLLDAARNVLCVRDELEHAPRSTSGTSHEAEIARWKSWAEWATEEYRRATGRDLQAQAGT